MTNISNIFTTKHLLQLASLFALLAILYFGSMQALTAKASVTVSDDYMATTTAVNTNSYGNTVTASKVLMTGSGSFGSFIITGAATGIVNFYDATTSDATKRASSFGTSTILIASFPASTAAGTYTMDVALNQGLFIDLVSGNMPTSTVTFRR